MIEAFRRVVAKIEGFCSKVFGAEEKTVTVSEINGVKCASMEVPVKREIIVGFTSRGPEETPVVFDESSCLADWVEQFGEPTNDAERYCYRLVKNMFESVSDFGYDSCGGIYKRDKSFVFARVKYSENFCDGENFEIKA